MMDCRDIYKEETEKHLKLLKNNLEAWLCSSEAWDVNLFQYSDPDFLFYRFIISLQEDSTEPLLTSIITKVLERYNYSFERSTDSFSFIISDQGQRIGYRFSDFFENENVNTILKNSEVDSACIIRTWKQEKTERWFIRENACFQQNGLKLKSVSIEHFFDHYFGVNEWASFKAEIELYLEKARERIGYKSLKYLSPMNLSSRKMYEEKVFASWQYEGYKYQIINRDKAEVKEYLYLSNYTIDSETIDEMINAFSGNRLYKTMIGQSEYAESFITSEWLYHSLKGTKNYDLTAIISGYLKSIEQLLCKIVMMNIDNGCKIEINPQRKNEAYKQKIQAYENEKAYNNITGKWETIYGSFLPLHPEIKKDFMTKQHLYIDLLETQKDYMNRSTGTFEHFLRNNPHIFRKAALSKTIADMVSCFRIECRNGYFHTHNLKDKDWHIVEKTRDNAIFLYFMLLGGCIIPKEKECELGILVSDNFDELCKRIRAFRHHSIDFIFEYADGQRLNLVYDRKSNTAEYTENGIEHYESLRFFAVDDFSIEAYEQLDRGIREEQIVYLTRGNLPDKVYGVHRNHEFEEIMI